MEVLGGVASLVTLLETARRVCKLSYGLYKGIEGAPEELEKVTSKSGLTSSMLEQIIAFRPLMGDGEDQLLPIELRMTLAVTLENMQGCLIELQRFCNRSDARTKFRTRLRWAILDKKVVDKILSQLRDAEANMALNLLTMNVRISLINRTSAENVVEAQNALSRQIEISVIQGQRSKNTRAHDITEVDEDGTTALEEPKDEHEGYAIKRGGVKQKPAFSGGTYSVARAGPLQKLHWLAYLGLSGNMVYHWDSSQSTYSLQLSSWLPKILGQRALILELTIRQYVLSWTQISVLYGSLGVCVIVPCQSPLMVACDRGNLKSVRSLIESRKGTVNDRRDKCSCAEYCLHTLRPYEGETPLVPAIRSANIEIVEYLVSVGADVNALDYRLRSPLQVAFREGLLDVARLLVNKGASIQHVDLDGNTVIQELFRVSWTAGFGHSKMMWSEKIGLPCMRYLASISFEHFDTPNKKGHTGLGKACEWGASYDVWDALIKYGALSQTTHQYRSLLWDAAYWGNPTIVRNILRDGYDTTKHENGPRDESPLHAAAGNGRTESAALLLDHGANVNALDIHSQTPLHKAVVHRDCADMVSLLLEHGANVNVCDVHGYTPLHWAVCDPYSRSAPALLEVLFNGGADPHALAWSSSEQHRTHHNGARHVVHPGIRMMRRRTRVMPRGIVLRRSINVMAPGMRITPGEAARQISRRESGSKSLEDYVAALKTCYPEIDVDDEGEIFWDALETNPGTGEGGSYEAFFLSYEPKLVYDT